MSIRTFKTQIYPSAKIRQEFKKGFGTRRWVWNWAVDQYCNQQNRLSWTKLDTLINVLRVNEPDKYGWIGEVNTMIKTSTLKQFHRSRVIAYKKYYLYGGKKPVMKFLKKSYDKQSFCLFNKKKNSTLRVESQFVFSFNWTKNFGRIKVRTRESLLFLDNANIKEITIIQQANKFYIAICYEKTNCNKQRIQNGNIGLDLGVKHLFASYDGVSSVIEPGANLEKYDKQIHKLQRKLAKKQYCSKNYIKVLIQLQKWHMKKVQYKKDYYYNLCSNLCGNYNNIMIDDFSYNSYLNKNRQLNKTTRHSRIRKLFDISPGLFKIILSQKAEEYQSTLFFVPTGTPTTQTCSSCHRKNPNKLSLNDRIFSCPYCHLTIDRDINSAINAYNLLIFKLSSSVVDGEVKAWGLVNPLQ